MGNRSMESIYKESMNVWKFRSMEISKRKIWSADGSLVKTSRTYIVRSAFLGMWSENEDTHRKAKYMGVHECTWTAYEDTPFFTKV